MDSNSFEHSLQVNQAATISIELDSVTKTQKIKKRGNKFVPIFCSVIDVANINGPKMISGFNYKTLKADVRKLQGQIRDRFFGIPLAALPLLPCYIRPRLYRLSFGR
ncbi:hypothetical protein L1887_33834 [Cichorium endivia]|nr:hypothetical protein L1887_33834 [Cichorium endivia]